MSKISFSMLFTLLLFALIVPVQAAEESAKTSTDYQAQLQTLEQETQTYIAALSAQIEEADADQREAIDKQIIEAKRDAEIQRLTILLDWARSEGNEARIAEVQQALDNWVNPPQPQQLPSVTRDLNAPGTQTVPQQDAKSGANSK